MARTVGIDFGTSNSVISVVDEATGRARVPVIEGISREIRYRIDEQWDTVHVIPSLISYVDDNVYIGEQVYAQGLSEAPTTFRWMKSYICARQPLPRRVPGAAPCQSHISKDTCNECIARTEGGRVCNFIAGRDFLSRLILYAADFCDLDEDELVFTIPVETYENYSNWISEVCDATGVTRYRVVDEPTACVLGYEQPVRKDQAFAVIDFGGGTLHVSVIRIDFASGDERKCTVLGKAGVPVGGRNVTQWLYEDFLDRCGAAPHTVGTLSTHILMEVEAAKEALSFEDTVGINIVDDQTAKVYSADYTRSGFQDLLMKRGLLSRVEEVLAAAFKDAQGSAVGRDEVVQVLLVGGSTLIPSVRMPLQLAFGDRLAYQRPFISIALGACRYGAGDLVEWIQHDYAIRHYAPDTNSRDFKTLVERMTTYPSDGVVARYPVAGVYDGQVRLGVLIYERGDRRTAANEQFAFDENGRPRVIRTRGENHHYCINADDPTFLHANPPAKKGEFRFDLSFSIDGNKRLLMTAEDVVTGQFQYRDYPVAKLK